MKWFLAWVVAPIGLLAILYKLASRSPEAFLGFIMVCIVLFFVWGRKIRIAVKGAEVEEYSRRASKGWHRRKDE